MPKVYNKYHRDAPHDAVYVGRPSPYGNPFVIGKDGTREEVIAKFRRYVSNSPYMLRIIEELHGKDLVCFCAPKPCHADVLLELANEKGKTEQ